MRDKILGIFCGSILLTACSLKVDERMASNNLAGFWKSTEGTMHFKCSGNVNFKASKEARFQAFLRPFTPTEFENASFEGMDEQKIYLNAMGIDLKYSVEKKPHLVNGKWLMTMDGIEWKRKYVEYCTTDPMEALSKNDIYVDDEKDELTPATEEIIKASKKKPYFFSTTTRSDRVLDKKSQR